MPLNATNGIGESVTSTPNSGANYSLPATVSDGNVSANISYAGSWAVTQVSDSSGATTSTTYDSFVLS